MVEIADINNGSSLAAWLKDKPRGLAVLLAHRAAARVMPLYWAWAADPSSKGDLTDISTWRILPISRVFAVYVSGDIGAAHAAAAAAAQTTADAAAHAAAAYADAAAAYAAADAAAAYVAHAAADVADIAADAAYAAADAAYAAHADIWEDIRRDAADYLGSDMRAPLSLWQDGMPPEISEAWDTTRTGLAEHIEVSETGWQFWIDWYEAQLSGADQNWEMLKEIALIPNEDWKQGAAHVNALIADIVKKYERKARTELSKAFPVDFTFDSLQRIMRMVGIEDDTAHLRDPAVVQSFLDDCEELRDVLQDFADYTEAGKAGRNHLPMLHLSADKVLAELKRTNDTQHLRARHIVRLAGRLEAFSKEEGAREELGKTLSGALDDSLSLLRIVTRRHFGPSYTALAPLTQLSLDHVDQDAVVALFDEMIERLEILPSDELIALDEDGMSVFRDMIRELHEFRAAVLEASSDEFREILEQRFAESIGGTGLAFGRFFEKSSSAAGQAGRATDTALKTYKRVNGLNDIIDFIRDFLAGGGTS